ncbi:MULTISPECIES: SURF1 family protein [unclassified Sphingobium]|uniref:SURF1 family protein n=1 Tax=unclassified Sphingobium TaxID=2611147 RepID=UPI0022250CA9|nr:MULTISPECIES: SURF1 family protein [unclassified Sphingobium]MCW2393953.1 cytochrome oxidase assembly protein ShyY1 [Sphingobium sp. B8D3B]MCW2417467.1 cytochrome oxidase assembly protein ShyY1 [Sphingobium sp. B8D3C]
MSRRVPLVPTVLVGLAVAVMIALGIWQIGRAHQKEAALDAWRANLHLPLTAFPRQNPTDQSYMFRRLAAQCLRVVDWQVIGGRARSGETGWRHIAYCATGAEGPGLVVDMGVSVRPDGKTDWQGGPVTGTATHEPDNSSLLARVQGKASPLRLMIVAEEPAPGLLASAPPDPSSVPNNHRSYAVQWFLFATIALVIYALALRKRWRGEAREG